MAYITLFKELWRYAEGHRWKIIVFFILHILSVSSLIASPLIFAKILNVFQTTTPEEILSEVMVWTLLWVGATLWFEIFHRIGRWFEFDVAYKAKQRMTNHYYDTLTKLPLKWHSDHHSGESINRVKIATEAIFMFGVSQQTYIEYLVLFWGPLIALSFLSWQISLVALVVAMITLAVMHKFNIVMVKYYRIMNDVEHKIASTFFDYVSNIKTIITLRLSGKTGAELDYQFSKGYAPMMKAETIVNQYKWFTVSSIVAGLKIGVIFYYIWLQLAKGTTVMIGNIAAVFQYLTQLTNTFLNINAQYQTLLKQQTDLDAAKDLVLTAEKNDIKEMANNSEWQQIKIAHLSFEYEDGKQTLRDIELSFSKGDRIALVGESGSGKSSLMAILRGLYEPASVQLTIDGENHDRIAPLFGTTTLIPQEPEIFENTIRFNITVGIEHDESELITATKLARFDRVLERLPQGFDTDVREKGVTLSGGERQRLALARGILAAKNSSIILMDEPTSSVDAHNELVIYENIFDHFNNRTVISSIHRLHLLGKFNSVIVMDQGKIVQTGTFEDLKNQAGLFQTLWDKYQESARTEGE